MLNVEVVAELAVRCRPLPGEDMLYACDGRVGPTYGSSAVIIGPSEVKLVVLLSDGASDDAFGTSVDSADDALTGPITPSCLSARLSGLVVLEG